MFHRSINVFGGWDWVDEASPSDEVGWMRLRLPSRRLRPLCQEVSSVLGHESLRQCGLLCGLLCSSVCLVKGIRLYARRGSISAAGSALVECVYPTHNSRAGQHHTTAEQGSARLPRYALTYKCVQQGVNAWCCCSVNKGIRRRIDAVLVYHTRFLSAVFVILHVRTVHLFDMAL